MTEAQNPVQRGFGCRRCDKRWTGANQAHCSADGCHRSFAGVQLFDLHRRERAGADGESVGYCKDPATITRTPKGGEPERVMWETNGIWYAVPEPTDRSASLTAWREARKAGAA